MTITCFIFQDPLEEFETLCVYLGLYNEAMQTDALVQRSGADAVHWYTPTSRQLLHAWCSHFGQFVVKYALPARVGVADIYKIR